VVRSLGLAALDHAAHEPLGLAEVVLLLADDGAGPHETQPAHDLARREAEVADGVEGDEGSRAAQAGLAVHGGQPRRGVGGLKEAALHVRGGRRAVLKLQLVHGHAIRVEGIGVVARLIEADHVRYTQGLEDVKEVLGTEISAFRRTVAVYLSNRKILWALKCNEFTGDNDGQISVQRIFVVLKLFGINRAPLLRVTFLRDIEPSKLHRSRKTLTAVEERKAKISTGVRCITKSFQ